MQYKLFFVWVNFKFWQLAKITDLPAWPSIIIVLHSPELFERLPIKSICLIFYSPNFLNKASKTLFTNKYYILLMSLSNHKHIKFISHNFPYFWILSTCITDSYFWVHEYMLHIMMFIELTKNVGIKINIFFFKNTKIYLENQWNHVNKYKSIVTVLYYITTTCFVWIPLVHKHKI